jgi:hypothetical protein
MLILSLREDTRWLQAADPGPSPELGRADTRWLQAINPWLSSGLGKADTRPGKSHGLIACATAPELHFRAAEKVARRMQPASGGHDHRWRHTDAAERRARFMPHSTPDPVGAACTVQVFRLGGKLAQVPRTTSD